MRVWCTHNVGAFGNRFRLPMLADNFSLNTQQIGNPFRNIKLIQLYARRPKLRFDLLRGSRFSSASSTAHNVGNAQDFINLNSLVLAILAQMVNGINNLVNRNPINLAFYTTRFSKHCPVINRNKLVFSRLIKHALNTVMVLIIYADNLSRPRQPGNARVYLIKFIKLILCKNIISATNKVAAGYIGNKRLGTWEKPIKLQRIILNIQNNVAAFGVPINLLILFRPNLKYLSL